jgi:tRNA 2-selenouridine synthase
MALNITGLDPEEFLARRAELPLVDVRSPSEYAYGHIPGAVNIPLFDDNQRAEVGTLFKKEGSTPAVIRGIELSAPEMPAKLKQALTLATERELLLYCWRGGMRSEAMAWLFHTGGLKPMLLNGGYKAYRNHILAHLAARRDYVILGGLTGSGKTGILNHMGNAGAQVTDLERLASHRGSAFGALGQPPQPSSEHFANLLYEDLSDKREGEVIWLEDESRNIGTVFMPDSFFEQMQRAPVVALMMSIETRMPRLLEEYTSFPLEQITASVMRISKRLGGDRTREAIEALQRGDFSTAIRITLEYYDKSYRYGLSKRPEGQVIYVETDTDDVAVNASKIAAAAAEMVSGGHSFLSDEASTRLKTLSDRLTGAGS